jgi:hypothetical protein
MKANIGTPDRLVRLVLGVALLLAAVFGGVGLFDGAVVTYGAAIVGLVLVATAALRFCPLYAITGIRTCQT